MGYYERVVGFQNLRECDIFQDYLKYPHRLWIVNANKPNRMVCELISMPSHQSPLNVNSQLHSHPIFEYTFPITQQKNKLLMIPFRNKNIFVQRPFFTHFASLPLISPYHRQAIRALHRTIRQAIHSHPKYTDHQMLKEHHHDLSHVTLFKLTLRHSASRSKMVEMMKRYEEQIRSALEQMVIEIVNVSYFKRFNKNEKCNEITVIYGQLGEAVVGRLNVLIDRLMRRMLQEQIVAVSQLKEMNVFYDHNSNLYKPQTLHVSLFRARNILEDDKIIDIFKAVQQEFKQIQAVCQYFDISSMGKQYDHTNFYLPLHRISIRPIKQKQQNATNQHQLHIN